MKGSVIVKILICAVAASVFAGESDENEDVSGFIGELKNIILQDQDKGYMQANDFFKSQEVDKRYEYAKAILERVAYEDFGSDSRTERYIYRTAVSILQRGDKFKSDKIAGNILYQIFLNRPDFTGSGFYSDLYEMNKPEDIHIDELRRELISGRARILELAIHWDIKDLEGVTKEILQDESSSWGMKEVYTVDGVQQMVRRIKIYPSLVFKKHDRCAELGDANIAPSVDVNVVDLAKAYLGWVGNREYIEDFRQEFLNAKQNDYSKESDSYDKQIYYYSLLYLIGHPPAKRPLSENDTGIIIPGIGPLSIEK